MPLFQKKPDLISERARTLNAEIEALESKIKKLDAQLSQRRSQPRLRSTAVPNGATVTHSRPETAWETPPASHEPVFEEISKEVLDSPAEVVDTPEHFNERGIRKYDLTALIRKTRAYFEGPKTGNPRLVTYLAAGGVQGLRPMRYEKRVARNRFMALTTIFLLLLTGLVWWYIRNR
jgi:hypothetical protein